MPLRSRLTVSCQASIDETNPSVRAVVPDELIELTAQTTPTGVSRIGTRRSTVADIDGIDQRVDADIAIVDTGIAKHADLNVAGGVNCTTSDRSNWHDWNGHGTHVAGTVAALDNTSGVVGVLLAPVLAAVGALVALLKDCTIHVERLADGATQQPETKAAAQ